MRIIVVLVISLVWLIIGFAETQFKGEVADWSGAAISGAMILVHVKFDRLTRFAKDLCSLREPFEKRSVALISVAESLDTASAGGAWSSPSWPR